MNKSEAEAAITMVYGNLGNIKDVTSITIDDLKEEIVCAVSGYTARHRCLPRLR
jgi:hypothetical protein